MTMKAEKKALVKSLIATAFIAAAVLVAIVFAPEIRAGINRWTYGVEKADDNTNYDKLKKVEDTLRAYVASYEADKITYESGINSDDAAIKETAEAAKIRANRTAATYNKYYLENNYIWKDNVPSDINKELKYLE